MDLEEYRDWSQIKSYFGQLSFVGEEPGRKMENSTGSGDLLYSWDIISQTDLQLQ